MGRKSQLKRLGQEVTVRVKLAKMKIKDEFERGKLYGQSIKLMRKYAPMESHIESLKCDWCRPRFLKMKNDPEILALPEGSDQQATEIIMKKPGLRKCLEEIIKCPNYRREKHDQEKRRPN